MLLESPCCCWIALAAPCLQKAVLANNRAAALDIYLNGKNSVGGSGLRKFMTWATAVHAGEPYYDMLAARYGPNFTTTLNDTIT